MKRLLLIALLWTAAQEAKADYLFTWESKSNLFQASFKITDAEAQPGQNYYPNAYPLSLTYSVSVSSPDGNTFRWGYNAADQDRFGMIGSGPPLAFVIDLFGPGSSGWDALSIYAYPSGIIEYGWLSGSSNPVVLYTEYGPWWNVTYIPEPPAPALLAIGATALFIKRRRRSYTVAA